MLYTQIHTSDVKNAFLTPIAEVVIATENVLAFKLKLTINPTLVKHESQHPFNILFNAIHFNINISAEQFYIYNPNDRTSKVRIIICSYNRSS